MRILLTGALGQLGRALVNHLTGTAFLPTDVREMDITSPTETKAVIKSYRPEAVIHCAAYTNVDAAEADPSRAYAVNAAGTQNVASACLDIGAKMVYVSTDYVFDGRSREAYREFDTPCPINVYGWSKLGGEVLARQTLNRLFIARTSWLYGEGANFIRTMLAMGRHRNILQVVDDQFGCPTYAEDVAEILLRLVETDSYGIYHVANRGHTSWHGLASRIFTLAGMHHMEIQPVTSAEFSRPALRPAYSVLGSVMLENVLGSSMRSWEDALRDYLAEEGYLKGQEGRAG